MLLILAWALSLTLSLIPLTSTMHGSFVEKAWIVDNAFFGDIVYFNDAKTFAQRVLTYLPSSSKVSNTTFQDIASISSWLELEKLFAKYPSGSADLRVFQYFG